jgi:hypothetical protein
MQTITDLNKKVSYRLIKALYFFVLIGVLVFSIKYFYEDNIYYPMDYDQTRISCQNTKERFDIEKSRYNIGSSLSDEQKNTIAKEICGITGVQIIDKYDDTFLSSNNVFVASKGVMIEKLNLLKFSGYLLAIIIGLMLLAEILRRTIYYIFLGSLKPKE